MSIFFSFFGTASDKELSSPNFTLYPGEDEKETNHVINLFRLVPYTYHSEKRLRESMSSKHLKHKSRASSINRLIIHHDTKIQQIRTSSELELRLHRGMKFSLCPLRYYLI
jgi:hypothetical protein